MTDLPPVSQFIHKFESLAENLSKPQEKVKTGGSFGIKSAQLQLDPLPHGIRAKGAQPMVLDAIKNAGNREPQEPLLLQGAISKSAFSEIDAKNPSVQEEAVSKHKPKAETLNRDSTFPPAPATPTIQDHVSAQTLKPGAILKLNLSTIKEGPTYGNRIDEETRSVPVSKLSPQDSGQRRVLAIAAKITDQVTIIQPKHETAQAENLTLETQESDHSSKVSEMSIIPKHISTLKENLVNISVRYKNLHGKSKSQIKQECKIQYNDAKQALKNLKDMKKTAGEEQKIELTKAEKDLEAMRVVLKQIAQGRSKMALTSKQKKFLDIIRPRCIATTPEKQKISEDDLITINNIAKNFDDNDVQQMVNAIVLDALASPDPAEIKPFNLIGWLGRANVASANLQSKKDEWLSKAPLKDATDAMEGQYKKSERYLTEQVQKREEEYHNSKEHLYLFCDVFSEVFGVDNPKEKIQDATKEIEEKLKDKNLDAAQKKVLLNELNDKIRAAIGPFYTAMQKELEKREPEYQRLLAGGEPTRVDLAKFRMSHPENMDKLKQKIIEKIPIYAGDTYRDKPQGHGIELILTSINADGFTTTVRDSLESKNEAETQMAQFKAG